MKSWKHFNFNIFFTCTSFVFKEVLNPSQIVKCLTFLTLRLTARLIKKFMQNITSMSWLGLLIKVLHEWLKFDNVCINFLNKTNGQSWDKKTNIRWGQNNVLKGKREDIMMSWFYTIIISKRLNWCFFITFCLTFVHRRQCYACTPSVSESCNFRIVLSQIFTSLTKFIEKRLRFILPN
jgi:hypothetical protein